MNIMNKARFLFAMLLMAVCASQIFATANHSMPIKYSAQTERITSVLDEARDLPGTTRKGANVDMSDRVE